MSDYVAKLQAEMKADTRRYPDLDSYRNPYAAECGRRDRLVPPPALIPAATADLSS
jgi:hypothetical protein